MARPLANGDMQRGNPGYPPPPAPLRKHTMKVTKTTIRQGPVLRQGSAHKRKPKGAVRRTTVRRAPGAWTRQCLCKGCWGGVGLGSYICFASCS